jgi:hypothetical protein
MDDELKRKYLSRLAREALNMQDGDECLVDYSSDILHLIYRALEVFVQQDEFLDDTHIYPILDEIAQDKYSEVDVAEMEQDGTFRPDVVKMNDDYREIISALMHSFREVSLNAHRRETEQVVGMVKHIMGDADRLAAEATPQLVKDIYKMLEEEGK